MSSNAKFKGVAFLQLWKVRKAVAIYRQMPKCRRLFLFTQLAHMDNQVVDLIRAQASLERGHTVLTIADHLGQLRVGLALDLR